MHSKHWFVRRSSSLSIVSLSLLLAACGGSGSNDSTNVPIVETPQTPLRLSANNWVDSNLANNSPIAFNTSFAKTTAEWNIEISDSNITNKSHVQVYLDTDNDPSTGFQFDNEAWASKSGADYLIQDSLLFKSTSNSSNWDWEIISAITPIFDGLHTINVTLPVETFSGLCNDYAIGVIGMDKDWNIEIFNPQSNSLLDQSISYCDAAVINTPPVITLTDSAPLVLGLGSSFIVPAVNANDEQDGDLSNEVTNTHNVNTSEAGVYSIVYNVTDSAGLSAQAVEREVIVKDTTSVTGITVDGNIEDWADILPLSQSNGATIKVTDDETHVFILIEAVDLGVNTQLLIDNGVSYPYNYSGFRIHPWSFRYLIENQDLAKYTGETTGYEWAWDFNEPSFPLVRIGNIMEIAIPIVSFDYIGSTNRLNIAFMSKDENWETNYSIQPKYYYLLNPQAPNANADQVNTPLNTPIVIDVLANDTDPNGDVLTISSIEDDSYAYATFEISGSKIIYTPTTTTAETDFFSYIITDEDGNTDRGSVRVDIE